MNSQKIHEWKIGKLKLDINQLDNYNKVQYAKIENLINDLIKFKEKIEKLNLDFDNEFRGG